MNSVIASGLNLGRMVVAVTLASNAGHWEHLSKDVVEAFHATLTLRVMKTAVNFVGSKQHLDGTGGLEGYLRFTIVQNVSRVFPGGKVMIEKTVGRTGRSKNSTGDWEERHTSAEAVSVNK